MALSRDKKAEIIKQVGQLLVASKLTVVVYYRGTSVKQLQDLRRQARTSGSLIRVVKNRLMIQALKSQPALAKIPTDKLADMLIYVFNDQDEIAGAQLVKNFVKATNASLEFIGAISPEGRFASADEVKQLANLLPKDQQIAAIIQLLGSPLRNLIQHASSQLPSVLAALKARAS